MSLNKQEIFHFMGIGGVGMSALAQLMVESGYTVTGCDNAANFYTDRLEKLGVKIDISHNVGHLNGADCLVYSSAIAKDHPELKKGREQGKKILQRAQLLALLAQGKKEIAICGSHGKTTTTAMLASILMEAGLDPTVVIGAEMKSIGSNACLGKGEIFLYEADESDGSFTYFSPQKWVLTNLDNDHLEHYRSFENLKKKFLSYFKQLDDENEIFLSFEDEVLREWKGKLKKETFFGFSSEADLQATHVKVNDFTTVFDLVYQGENLGSLSVKLPGRYNVLNALAACGVALSLNIPFKLIQKGLSSFEGPQRRFDVRAKVNDIWVVDDYAHHPTEIKEVLEAAQLLCQGNLYCIFQPHRYTRTRDLQKEFPKALSVADQVILTDIYPASEVPIPGIDGELILKWSQKSGYAHFKYVAKKEEIVDQLIPQLKQGDMVVTVGAGDIDQVGLDLIQKIQKVNQ